MTLSVVLTIASNDMFWERLGPGAKNWGMGAGAGAGTRMNLFSTGRSSGRPSAVRLSSLDISSGVTLYSTYIVSEATA